LPSAGRRPGQRPDHPPAGEYIFERGSGALRVKADGHFDITTIGANAHTCALDGTIVRGKAKIDDTACVVSFAMNADKVQVSTNGEDQCRESCGARATFEGTYTRPTPGCTDKAVAARARASSASTTQRTTRPPAPP
jgi:hypothetical protein